MALLTEEQIEQELKRLNGWTRQGNEITKEYTFKDFVQAMAFTNSVALVAERADHHPDIDIRWNKVKLTLSTHSEGGLTEKDVALATRIDSL